jgi:hypothetical protein
VLKPSPLRTCAVMPLRAFHNPIGGPHRGPPPVDAAPSREQVIPIPILNADIASDEDSATEAEIAEEEERRRDPLLSCFLCGDKYYIKNMAMMVCCRPLGTDRLSDQHHYCNYCIRSMSELDIVPRCPTCLKAFFYYPELEEVRRNRKVDVCSSCSRNGPILHPQLDLCESCILGMHFPLRYKCKNCNIEQQLPRPIWLSQPKFNKFSSMKWPCHGKCQKPTRWQVVVSDAHKIPPEHCPESWERKEEWIQNLKTRQKGLRIPPLSICKTLLFTSVFAFVAVYDVNLDVYTSAAKGTMIISLTCWFLSVGFWTLCSWLDRLFVQLPFSQEGTILRTLLEMSLGSQNQRRFAFVIVLGVVIEYLLLIVWSLPGTGRVKESNEVCSHDSK